MLLRSSMASSTPRISELRTPQTRRSDQRDGVLSDDEAAEAREAEEAESEDGAVLGLQRCEPRRPKMMLVCGNEENCDRREGEAVV